jgi:predicted PurR-regulated permease PerM
VRLPADSVSNGTADSALATEPTPATEQNNAAVDTSLLTLPAARMQIDARGLALGLLAAFATVFILSWAQSFVVPVLLGIIISYTLNPLVDWLQVIKVPRVLGTGIVMITIIGALTVGTYSLRAQMRTIVAQVPEAAATISSEIARVRSSEIGNLGKMQAAAIEMEQASTQELGGHPATTYHPRHCGSADVQAR